jgi:hypothetical protein
MILHNNPTLYEVNRPIACSTAPATTIDLTEQGLATGNTSSMPAAFAGDCGGEASPERWHLFRVQGMGSGILEVRIIGLDFAPLAYVRGGDCADPAAEVVCQAADPATELLLQVDYDGEGAWFVAVDGRDGGSGTFVLEVEAIPDP